MTLALIQNQCLNGLHLVAVFNGLIMLSFDMVSNTDGLILFTLLWLPSGFLLQAWIKANSDNRHIPLNNTWQAMAVLLPGITIWLYHLYVAHHQINQQQHKRIDALKLLVLNVIFTAVVMFTMLVSYLASIYVFGFAYAIFAFQ